MASDRISRDTAEMVPLPPNTWYVKTVGWLLNQPEVKDNILKVPLNENLMNSIKEHGMLNPIFTMPNWYPLAGSQRMRCLHELIKDNPKIGEQEVRVCRIDKEYWRVWFLWGDKEFRNKAIAVYFQMIELVWKSRYYQATTDPNGELMIDFEKEGDNLNWNF